MPNTRSAAKMMRVSERKRMRNRPVRSAVRGAVARARRELTGADPAQASELVQAAVQALDRAAQKGVIHRNAAARRKSRLMKRLNAAQTAG
ncbi:MAG: 30S ribosomal protein S20 [Chloroflexi bacterium]|nr:30S ribosomal protein S20 [Chloroflexota bacterium]